MPYGSLPVSFSRDLLSGLAPFPGRDTEGAALFLARALGRGGEILEEDPGVLGAGVPPMGGDFGHSAQVLRTRCNCRRQQNHDMNCRSAALPGPLPAAGLATSDVLVEDLARGTVPNRGEIALPDEPGLGVTPLPAALNRCAVGSAVEIHA